MKLLIIVLCALLVAECKLNFKEESRNDEFYLRKLNDPPQNPEINPGNSYITCSACNVVDECSWIDSEGAPDTADAVLNYNYDSFFGYSYGESATISGTITLSNITGETVELYAKNGASSDENFLCEWIIIFDSTKTVELYIDRPSSSNEDIVIIVNSDSSANSTTLTNKDLLSGTSSSYEQNFTSISNMTIRADIWNDNQNYLITVAQSFNSDSSSTAPDGFEEAKNIIQILALIIAICFGFVGLSIAAFALCKTRVGCRCRKYPLKFYKKTRKNNNKIIDMTMESMVSGTYEHISGHNYSDKCIICLDIFSGDEQVHITNECTHLFHSSCLLKWYKMIADMRQLSCPHGNIVNQIPTEKQVYNTDYIPSTNTKNVNMENYYSEGEIEESKMITEVRRIKSK